ncbi:retropepsin-like aspartic protease [Aeromonas salmonicida]|uniref:retropepsin-like aspartic protease n=1 Tax=Aeromonas salmonicida TaxID=645 RepID=UPI000B05268B|nr:retropepsin-like aspartic protease [Aeromonas salmonicida]
MTLQFNAMALAILILSAVHGCSVPDSSATAIPSGPVLAVHYERAPLIPVTIAGEQYQFLLDTGASITVIDRRLASRFKALSLSELPQAYQADFANVASVSGQVGSDQLGFVQPVPFSVGSVTIDDSDLWGTMDFELFSQSIGTRIDGVLGIDTIRRFNWVFDNEQHQINASLRAPSAAGFERCIGYEDSYNRSPAIYLTHGESSVRMYLDTGPIRAMSIGLLSTLWPTSRRCLVQVRAREKGLMRAVCRRQVNISSRIFTLTNARSASCGCRKMATTSMPLAWTL